METPVRQNAVVEERCKTQAMGLQQPSIVYSNEVVPTTNSYSKPAWQHQLARSTTISSYSGLEWDRKKSTICFRQSSLRN